MMIHAFLVTGTLKVVEYIRLIFYYTVLPLIPERQGLMMIRASLVTGTLKVVEYISLICYYTVLLLIPERQ